MTDSILTTTKAVLGLADSYTDFDLDIVTYINTAFATLYQLGLATTLANDAFMITDATPVWADLGESKHILNLIRTYVLLKVRMLFDPPGTSFLIQAQTEQLAELEFRISSFREVELSAQ